MAPHTLPTALDVQQFPCVFPLTSSSFTKSTVIQSAITSAKHKKNDTVVMHATRFVLDVIRLGVAT